MAEPQPNAPEPKSGGLNDLSDDALGFGVLELRTARDVVLRPRTVLEAWMTQGPTGGGHYARPLRLYLALNAILMLVLGAAWALRLSLFITWRSWGQPEERRYRHMRQRNQPHFAWKSLYLVFGLQALLAWLVAMPFLAAAAAPGADGAWSGLDSLGLAVALFGLLFEATADAQMAAFKAGSPRADEVMDSGLWRYSRHPNYFGESCLWWGVACLAVAAGGAWWAWLSPVLVTFLLLKVSGVNLQAQHLRSRGPAHVEYMCRTAAFVPWPPKAIASG